MMPNLKIYKTHQNVELPKFHTKQSACFDLSYQPHGKYNVAGLSETNTPVTRRLSELNGTIGMAPGDRLMVPTGLIFDIPEGYSVRLHPRSGISYKNGVVLANCEGVIDSDYVEEIYVLLHNTSSVNFIISPGDRIAQAELVKVESYTIEETTEVPTQKTDRAGGMGSTGINSQVNVPDAPVKRGRGRPKKVTA